MTKVSPSLLSADFTNLSHEIYKLESAAADMLHIDVMDGHFVPNLTIGPPVIAALRQRTNLLFDVHLMIQQPEHAIHQYAESGADYITIHPESTIHLDRTINFIKSFGVRAVVALLPSTSHSVIEYVIDKIDLVLVMTVNPGFGGQKFMHNQLPKIKSVSQLISNKDILLAVDGGIDPYTAELCRNHGANILVSGSFVFNGDYAHNIAALR